MARPELWSFSGTLTVVRVETESLERLDARLQQYHSVSVNSVLDAVAYLRDAGDSVIFGGSLAYGLGNHLSDLDLVIAGPTTVESSRIPVEQFIDSLRIDVWKLGQALIEELFDRAEAALARDTALHGAFGNVDHENELKLMHRIAFGLVADGPGLELARGRDYRQAATRLVVREYAERTRESALLAQLALRVGRPLAAVVNARRAVEEALNATVAGHGLPFSGDKWLGERVGSLSPGLAAIHGQFERLPAAPDREAEAFVDQAVTHCHEIWGIDLTHARAAEAAVWRNTDLQLVEIGDQCLLLSQRFDALWRLEGTEADAWRRMTAESDVDGPEAWAVHMCDSDATALCFQLHEVGALGIEWRAGVSITDLTMLDGVSG
jgi:hypothetical protein